MLASTDVYRPAAMEQLARLAETLSIDYFEAEAQNQQTSLNLHCKQPRPICRSSDH